MDATITRISYSVDEVCELTGFGRTKIYNDITSGKLAARKSGRRTVIMAADLDRYCQSWPKIKPKGMVATAQAA